MKAQTPYQKPPHEILEILHAPVTPEVVISPTRQHMILVERERYPTIQELARPMLPLAGVRIDPANNGPQRTPQNTGLLIQKLGDHEPRRLRLPDGVRIGAPVWAADGTRFAFARYQPEHVELWVAEVASGAATQVKGISLNAAWNSGFQWMPDNRRLLCRTIPSQRGPLPELPTAPAGPNVQESFEKPAPARTHQDLLKTPHDDDLFEYYFTVQMTLADSVSGNVTSLGAPGLYTLFDPSPDAEHFLVSRLKRPFSRLLTVSGFAREVEVWDRDAQPVHQLASQPSLEGVPIDGVPTGPRGYRWQPTEKATLVWTEALDGGDPKRKVLHRDTLLSLAAPFKSEPREILRLAHRFSGITWGEQAGVALVSEYDRNRRWTRTFLLGKGTGPARLVWDRSVRDRYRAPGEPLMRTLPNGERVMWQTGDSIYLSGPGASAGGDFPFLDRFDLDALSTERLFQCPPGSYEFVVALVNDTPGVQFITQQETPASPPNYRLRGGDPKSQYVELTRFADPTPQLRKIKRQLVTYQREDGVPLSFTLYLPADYQPGTRLPTLVWAYPLEYNDADTAGQVSGSTNRFTTLAGASHLFFLTQGYAVLDSATMPIVGSPETMNDTFVEQIVASARAAIDKAVSLGVTDPERVGVGGHSYGAFMTANLLAHSHLFRAGIARSGAYNRTLTPFGFQGERRTFWEAPDTYIGLSPFTHAQRINDPILLIHGEMDDNDGTFPIQSQRLFQAIKGTGGKVRYVTLPHEAHGYAARESIEHVLYEMIAWFNTHVKNAAPRFNPNDAKP